MIFINYVHRSDVEAIKYLMRHERQLYYECKQQSLNVFYSDGYVMLCRINFFDDESEIKIFNRFRRQTDRKRRGIVFKEILEFMVAKAVVDKL